MPKTLGSARHNALIDLLFAQRRRAGLTQAEVAKALGRHQPFIATFESGQRAASTWSNFLQFAVAIMLLGGKSSHWTVAYKVTRKKLRLLDSNRRKNLRKEDCTLKPDRKQIRLIRREIVLVSRAPRAVD